MTLLLSDGSKQKNSIVTLYYKEYQHLHNFVFTLNRHNGFLTVSNSQCLVRKNIYVNKHKRLSNFTLIHKLRYMIITCIAVYISKEHIYSGFMYFTEMHVKVLLVNTRGTVLYGT